MSAVLPIVERLHRLDANRQFATDEMFGAAKDAAALIEELYEALDYIANQRNLSLGTLARKKILAALAKAGVQ